MGSPIPVNFFSLVLVRLISTPLGGALPHCTTPTAARLMTDDSCMELKKHFMVSLARHNDAWNPN